MRAQLKLDEAGYFLEQMKKFPDERTIVFNLDAFLCASRSVTFVLQKEFSENERFNVWYESKQREMQADPLLTFFRDMRNVSVKEHAPEPKRETHVSVVEPVVVTETVIIKKISPDGREEIFRSADEEPKPRPEGSVTISHKYFFVEKPEQDITMLCSLYLEKLTAILDDAKRILG